MSNEEFVALLKLPHDVGEYEEGSVVSVSQECLDALLRRFKNIELLDHTSRIYNHEPLDLEYFLANVPAEVEQIGRKKAVDKTFADMHADVAELKATKEFKRVSEYLVSHFLAKHQVFTLRDDKKTEVWIYREGIYISEGITYVIEFCRKVLTDDFKDRIVKEVVSKIQADTFIDAEEFFAYDTHVDLIPVQNGLLDLRTRELKPFDPDKVFFNKLPMTYDAEAKCPQIEQFFNEICRDKSDIMTLQEFLGTCVERRNAYERMVMTIGGGRNGKTKLAELGKRFLGVINCTGIQPSTFENPESFQTYMLHGKLANLCMDIAKTSLKNTSLLKLLSGGDEITVPRKFKTPLTFKNTAKFIFGANELPHTYDLTDGFWERWFLIDLPYTFVYAEKIAQRPENERHMYKPRVDNIIEQITTPDELSGMLNWVLDGLDRLRETGRFSYKYSPEEVKSMWIRKSDSFAAFFMDFMEIDYDHKVAKSEVRRAYVDYCKTHKLKVMTDKHIAKVMGEEGAITGRIREGEFDDYIWEGACFKPAFRTNDGSILGMDKFKKPSSKQEVGLYLEKNTGATRQDLYMKFGRDLIDRLVSDGSLIESEPDKLRLNR